MRQLTRFGLAAVLLSVPVAYSQVTPGTPTAPQQPTTVPQTIPQQPSTAPEQNPAGTPTPLPKPDITSTKADDKKAAADAKAKPDSLPSPGEALNPHIKPGSEDDVNAIGTRSIGGRGMGNWY